MIPYQIVPSFPVGPFHINMYGIMFSLGVLIATLLALRIARKQNIDQDRIYDLVLWILISVLVGARLFYVFFYWPKHIPFSLLDVFKIWEGGLAFFGGFLGALIAGAIYVKKHALNFWQYADLFTIPLVVGHIFGRVGDYLTGGHPAKITDVPWAIYLDGALRHPVVLYEIIGLILIVAVLLYLRKLSLFNGFLFSSYVMLYSVQRMILDFFRIEATDPRWLGLTPTQHLVILLFVLSAVFIWWNIHCKRLSKFI